MKKPEEYLKDVDWSGKWFWDIEEEVELILKQAQIDAYNKALEDASKLFKVHPQMSVSVARLIKTNNGSILKLKK